MLIYVSHYLLTSFRKFVKQDTKLNNLCEITQFQQTVSHKDDTQNFTFVLI